MLKTDVFFLSLIEPTYPRITNYIRFSSRSFASIMEELQLASENLVRGVMETVVFETLRSNGVEHLVVNCDGAVMK